MDRLTPIGLSVPAAELGRATKAAEKRDLALSSASRYLIPSPASFVMKHIGPPLLECWRAFRMRASKPMCTFKTQIREMSPSGYANTRTTPT
ncbi:hypothetical protein [Trinickia mobilis]|uniref:hypothetical protein n=1 Tax=Trinickia mobilis TaxID=2816356 RepID=UPI001A8C8C3D|nr:hypothetical protein [Trinickia mobilis]